MTSLELTDTLLDDMCQAEGYQMHWNPQAWQPPNVFSDDWRARRYQGYCVGPYSWPVQPGP